MAMSLRSLISCGSQCTCIYVKHIHMHVLLIHGRRNVMCTVQNSASQKHGYFLYVYFGENSDIPS
jgi:hypothetical protein